MSDDREDNDENGEDIYDRNDGIFFEDYDYLDLDTVDSEGDYVGAGGAVALISAIRIL